jgi:hypothetical protein
MEAHALVLLAVGDGPVQDADGLARLRPALQRLEIDQDGHEGLFGGQPGGGVGIGEDQAPARDHLQVDTGIGVIHALGAAHGHAVGTARARIELGLGDDPRARDVPLLVERGLRPGAEYLFGRGVEGANKRELAGGKIGFGVHGSLQVKKKPTEWGICWRGL